MMIKLSWSCKYYECCRSPSSSSPSDPSSTLPQTSTPTFGRHRRQPVSGCGEALSRNTPLRISFNVCRLFILKVWSSTAAFWLLDWPFTFSDCQYLHILSNSIRNIDFSSQGNCIWRPPAHFHNCMQGCWRRSLGTTRIMTTVTTTEATVEVTMEATTLGWRLPRTGNQWPSWGHTTWPLCWPGPWPPLLTILSNISTSSNI